MSAVKLALVALGREAERLAARFRTYFKPPREDEAIACGFIAAGLAQAQVFEDCVDIAAPLWQLPSSDERRKFVEEALRRRVEGGISRAAMLYGNAEYRRFLHNGQEAGADDNGPKIARYRMRVRFVLFPIPFEE